MGVNRVPPRRGGLMGGAEIVDRPAMGSSSPVVEKKPVGRSKWCLATGILFLWVYTMCLFSVLLPQLEETAGMDLDTSIEKNADWVGRDWLDRPRGEVISVWIFYHLCAGMVLLNLLRAMYVDPGRIPLETPLDRKRWQNGIFGIRISDNEALKVILADPTFDMSSPQLQLFLKSLPVVERKKKFGSFRFCSTCNLYKPDRTHHCRYCDRCILRMDHHCPWLGNCVGYRNLKFFILTLIFSALCLTFTIAVMTRRFLFALRPIEDTATFIKYDLPVIISFIGTFLLDCVLHVFLVFQLKLLASSTTTIELKEKKNHEDPFMRHRFRVAHTKFDKGWYTNVCDVMGPPWMWFLPTVVYGSGTYIETTEESSEDFPRSSLDDQKYATQSKIEPHN